MILSTFRTATDPTYARPELPTARHRCAAGCREITADKICVDCAELIVEVADAREDHANGCECLGCAAWSAASIVLGGTALVVARRVLA